MGLLQRMKGLFGSDESTTYECAECGTQYQARDEHGKAECPDCGAGGAAAVPAM